MDPSLVAGLVAWLLREIAEGVKDNAIDDIADPLWRLVKKWLGKGDSTLSDLMEDPHRADWPRVLRDRIKSLFDEDPRRVASLDRLLVFRECREALFQLPADNLDFTDRADEQSQLLGALDRDPESASTTAATVVITGSPMGGKSQLAIHLAHQIESKYPNGWFVIDLGGPLKPSHAVVDGLTDLLRAQGVPLSGIPETSELALKLYYSWFHGKRALVVIENAANAEQARLFLPPEKGCAAIVTSSRSLADLGSDRRCDLGTFSQPDAVELLRKLDRSSRTWTVEDPSAIEIVDWCERRPAVIASVAAWMSAPHVAALSLAEIVTKLRQGGSEADVLENPKLSKSLQLHYEVLAQRSPEAARLFRLLGLLPDVDTDVVMALANRDRNTAERALNVLVDARLLKMDGAYFRMPAMYRHFAEDRARAAEGNAECRAALQRALIYYLTREAPWATARAAGALEAIDQLPRERTNLVTAVIQAFSEGFYDLAWPLSFRCSLFFKAHRYVGAWEATARIGLRAADRVSLADHRLEALVVTHVNLGNALRAQGRIGEAIESYKHSIGCFDGLVRLGLTYEHRQHLDAARSCLELVERLKGLTFIRKSYPAEIRPSVDRSEAHIATLRDLIESHGVAKANRANEASTRTVESAVRDAGRSHESSRRRRPPDVDGGVSVDASG
ncbi:MAG: hypothetical protein ACRDYX_08950 [Egibacteraceae bacterium]